MPLQLRRGNTAEVNSITPLVGEIVYDTQLKRVTVGDGSTAGGIAIAGVSLNEAKDAAASSLLAGTHKNISFAYNSTTKVLSATVDILTHETIVADAIDVSAVKDGSTIILDVANATLYADVTGNVTGNINGVVTGTAGSSLIGNVTGNTTGYHTGDVKGSVFADDSTVLVDGVSGKLFGDLTGNVTGNLTGNVTGNLTGNADSATVSATINITNTNGLATVYYPTFVQDRTTGQILRGDVDLSYRTDTNTLTSPNFAGNLVGNVTGNVTGNTTGYHTGDVKGSIFADDSTVLVNSVAGLLNGSAISDITTPRVTINRNSDTGVSILMNALTSAGDTASGAEFRVSRGTLASPTAPSAGDPVFLLTGKAYKADITDYALSSAIIGIVGSDPLVPAVNYVSGQLEFYVTDGTRDLFDSAFVMSYDGAGVLSVPTVEARTAFQLPVYADDAARLAAIPSPAQGMMIFMVSGTAPAATNNTQVFNGSNWVNL